MDQDRSNMIKRLAAGEWAGVSFRPDTVCRKLARYVGRSLFALQALLVLHGCAFSPYDQSYQADSKDNTRIRSIIIHYTQEADARSIELLTSERYPVSSHYLLSSVSESGKTRIYQLVAEDERAWHAGRSGWKGRTNLNDTSIGIEIVYTPACENPTRSRYETCNFPDFDPRQIDILITLLSDLLKRYPDIEPLQIVGHSDIAPVRKIDPGPRFPWRYLYERGFGAWYDKQALERYHSAFTAEMPTPNQIALALNDIGYRIFAPSHMPYVVKAFQAHFLPTVITGEVDARTAAAIFALREKYERDKQAHKVFCTTRPMCGGQPTAR